MNRMQPKLNLRTCLILAIVGLVLLCLISFLFRPSGNEESALTVTPTVESVATEASGFEPGEVVIEPTATEASGFVAGELNPVGGAQVSARCEPVPDAMLQAIAEGLNGQDSSGLTVGDAVRSEDFDDLYFIAAGIIESSSNDILGIGVWAKSGTLDPTDGVIYAVDDMAKMYSQWDDGAQTDAQIIMQDDGAAEALACVQALLNP